MRIGARDERADKRKRLANDLAARTLDIQAQLRKMEAADVKPR